jgi:hypothetical protein
VLPRRPADVLRITDRTLGSSIEWIIGVEPDLEVVRQWRLDGASAEWVPEPFSDESDVLIRCTSYRIGSTRLSRNLAWVDLERVEPDIAERMVIGTLHLGQLFSSEDIMKHGYEFGTNEDVPDVDHVFERCFEGEEVKPYVWRRYLAVSGGEDAYVVVESLPTSAWEQVLDSEAERRRLRGAR